MKHKPKEQAALLIEDAQERFPFMDLETIQLVVLYMLEHKRIEGDVINDFYYESLKNFVLSYETI